MRVEPAVPPEVLAAIRAPLARKAQAAQVPIVQPLALALDLAGEALRARLFVVQAEGGEEMCLRPDFTLGVARHHLASGDASGRYVYEGAAFRAAGRDLGAQARGPVVVLVLDQARMADYLGVAAELRAAGIAAEVYLGTSGMRPQMKYADRRLSPAAVIIGGDEFAAGTVTIKDLDLGRALASGVTDNAAWRAERPGQLTVPRTELVDTIRNIVEARP